MYGLKQASSAWYQMTDATLLGLGFNSSIIDNGLFFSQGELYVMIVLVYVDKLIILSSNIELINALKLKLRMEFVRDDATYTITMSQIKYIEKTLEQFGIDDCKSIQTPLDTKARLLKLSNKEYDIDAHQMFNVPHKPMMGSLMFAMVGMRANLAFAISTMNQYMAKPSWSQ
jgi:hypothetical protein